MVVLRRDVNQMSWADFVAEFNTKFLNIRTMNAQQREFNSIKQGTMTVTEAVVKFNQLARLCPHLVPTEEERVRWMMEMFKPELAMAIDSGNQPPVTVADCLERAVRAEYRLTQVKEERAQFFKARKEERTKDKQSGENKKPQGGGIRNHSNSKSWNNNQSHHNNPNNKKRGKPGGNHYSENRNVQQKPNHYNSHPPCKTCGKNHPGEYRKGTMSYFACRQSGHFVKDCPKQNQPQGNQF